MPKVESVPRHELGSLEHGFDSEALKEALASLKNNRMKMITKRWS
jgi:hypothetical protein